MVSRLRPSQWIVALSRDAAVCQGLTFSYGVEPVQLTEDPKYWRDFAKTYLQEHQIAGHMALLVAGIPAQTLRKTIFSRFSHLGALPLELAPLGTLHFYDDLLVHVKR